MASASTSKEYKLAIKIAGAVSSSFDSAIGEAGQKIANLGSIAQAAAATAAAAWGALKLGEFISDAVDTYQGFEQAMANTSAIAGATGEQYDALRQAALDMGKATSKTASECADALGYMSLAGWDVNTSIANLEPVLRLSEATGLDLARCSDLVTDSMSALGLEAKDLSGYLDVAAMANNKSNQTAEMLMEAYIAVGGTMKGLKVPFQDTATALGVMANRGIKGSEAGTALNAVMTNLTTGAGQAGKMMEKLGISAFDSGGNFVGLEETIRRVYDATKDMTEEQRNAALAAIGGKQHLDALNALMGGLTTTTADGAIEWNALSDALYNSDGAMAKMAETVTNTWSGAKARLESAIQDLQINLVDTFAPYATSAINSVAAAIPNITAAIIPAAQGFVDYAIPRITAFKDRAVELFGMASEGISKVVSAHSSTFDKLGELGSRIGDIFASIQEKAQPVLDYIFSTGIPNVADGLLDLVDRLADLGLFLTEHKELVIAAIAAYAGFKGITALSNLGNKISNVSSLLAEFQGVTSSSSLAAAIAEGKLSKLSAVFGALTGQVKLTDVAAEAAKAKLSTFTSGFKTIGSVAKNAFTGLKGGITSIGTTLAGVGSKIMAFVAANPAVLVIAAIAAVIAIVVTLYNKCEWFRDAVDKVIAAIVGFFKNAWETIKSVWQALPEWFQTNIIDPVAGFFSGLWEGIKGIWQTVAGWFSSNVIQPIVNFFSPIVATVSGIFRGCWIIIQAIWKFASEWFQTNVITPIVNAFNTVIQAVSGFFSQLWSGIQAIWQTVAGWFNATVIQPLTTFFSAIPGVVGGFFSSLWGSVQAIWQTAAGWFDTTVIQPLVSFFSGIVASIGGFFSTLWQNIVSVWQAAGTWFHDNVATPINNAFQAVGDFVKGVFNGLIGFVESMINNVIGGINKFVGGFSGVVEKAAGFIGVEWEGIPDIPAVTLPRLAKGGIVTAPTLLEAGEAGDEAIIPLPELWGNMQDMIASAMNGATDGIAALADRLDAADIGESNPPIEDLLSRLDNLGNGDDPDSGGGEPPMQIIYSPTNHYHFEGEAPSKEDIAGAESMSQEQFNRMMAQWQKDQQRKNFRG